MLLELNQEKSMFENYENAEITIEELADIHPSKYMLYDIRDEVSHKYGFIPGGFWAGDLAEQAEKETLEHDKAYVLYKSSHLADIAAKRKSRDMRLFRSL